MTARRLLLNFDYDGVLVDSFDQLFRLVCATQAETGLGRPPELTDFTRASDLTFAGLAFLSDLSEDGQRTFARHFYRRQQEEPASPILFDGVGAILGELSTHHHMTIVSANSETVIHNVLGLHAIDEHFSDVHGAERKKAKSEILSGLVSESDFSPTDTFMIGVLDPVGHFFHGSAPYIDR